MLTTSLAPHRAGSPVITPAGLPATHSADFVLSVWLALLFLALGAQVVRAQSDWKPRASGVSTTLWGVTYAAGQFVAVGDAGTILTSPDGTTWTSRPSGTTSWLLAVAHGPQGFTAVGDQGTLLTSADGITWTARGSGGERLNAVVAGNGFYLAVGEAGVVRRSTDNVTWTTAAVPGAGWRRGIAAGDGRILVGGQAGGLWQTTDGIAFTRLGIATTAGIDALGYDGLRWQVATQDGTTGEAARPEHWTLAAAARVPGARALALIEGAILIVGDSGINLGGPNDTGANSPGLYGVTSSPTAVVAVGRNGTILSRPVVARSPKLKSPATNGGDAVKVLAIAGQPLELGTTSEGTPPLTFQWSFNDVAIATTPRPSLVITQPQTGIYRLRAANAAGTSDLSFSVEVMPTSPSVGQVDETFRPDLGVRPSTVTPVANGRFLVAAPQFFYGPDGPRYGFARLDADGAVDATFVVPGGVDVTGSVDAFRLLPDGRVLVGGRFSTIGGVARKDWARLLPDGRVDPGFTVDSLVTRGSSSLAILPDGRVAAFWSETAQGSSPVIMRMQPLLEDGTLDSTATRQTWIGATGISLGQIKPVVDSAGAVWVSVEVQLQNGNDPSTHHILVRLDPTTLAIDPVIGSSLNLGGKIGGITPTAGGTLVEVGTVTRSITGYSVSAQDVRVISAAGQLDPTPRLHLNGRTDYVTLPPAVAVLPDGSALYETTDRVHAIARQTADGRVDLEWTLGLVSTGLHPVGTVEPGALDLSAIQPLADGSLLLIGDFVELNGSPHPYLARVQPDRNSSETRLTALSIRAGAGTGGDTLIVGFALRGSGTKPMLVRAVGPTLSSAPFNVAGALADPRLTLYLDTTPIANNDNWDAAGAGPALSTAFARTGMFPLPAGSLDSALLSDLGPGLYSAHATTAGAAGGVVLAEVYDGGATPQSTADNRVIAFSARTRAGSGPQTLIAGFAITGRSGKRLLIRGVGPTLARYLVPAALEDPVITVYREQTPIATNDDWSSAEVGTLAAQVGAAPLFSGSKDAALAVVLGPGVYTVHVAGKNNSTGVALVEVYEVP